MCPRPIHCPELRPSVGCFAAVLATGGLGLQLCLETQALLCLSRLAGPGLGLRGPPSRCWGPSSELRWLRPLQPRAGGVQRLLALGGFSLQPHRPLLRPCRAQPAPSCGAQDPDRSGSPFLSADPGSWPVRQPCRRRALPEPAWSLGPPGCLGPSWLPRL